MVEGSLLVAVCVICDDDICHQAVKHMEKIYNYCSKALAAKAVVSKGHLFYCYLL